MDVIKYSIICYVLLGSASGFMSVLLYSLSCFLFFIHFVWVRVGSGIPDVMQNPFIMIRVGLGLHGLFSYSVECNW